MSDLELSGIEPYVLAFVADRYEPDVRVILDEMDDWFDAPVEYGRVYQTLERLADHGLVQKQSIDGRVNGYMITKKGLQQLKNLQKLLDAKIASFPLDS